MTSVKTEERGRGVKLRGRHPQRRTGRSKKREDAVEGAGRPRNKLGKHQGVERLQAPATQQTMVGGQQQAILGTTNPKNRSTGSRAKQRRERHEASAKVSEEGSNQKAERGSNYKAERPTTKRSKRPTTKRSIQPPRRSERPTEGRRGSNQEAERESNQEAGHPTTRRNKRPTDERRGKKSQIQYISALRTITQLLYIQGGIKNVHVELIYNVILWEYN